MKKSYLKKNLFLKTIFVVCVLMLAAAKSFSQCNTPDGGPEYEVSSTSERIYYQGNGSGTLYLEYGLPGFTPGTQGTPGVGGTLFLLDTDPDTVTGLTGGTLYDYYIRKNCSGNIWSANSTVQSFLTFPNCGTAPSISCNSMVTATIQPLTTPIAFENMLLCSSLAAGGEAVFSFTPTQSGMHSLFGSPLTGDLAFYGYKAASAGCNISGWTCIGSSSNNGMPYQFSFGPLTAGTQYYILVDHNVQANLLNTSFRIECPYCAGPTNVNVSNITPNAAKVNFTGSYSYVEYGLHNFIPGTGTTAGTGGTLIQGSNPVNISGLSASTQYDVYVRTWCGGNNTSPNSAVQSFTTPACPTIFNYTTLGSTYTMTFSGRGFTDNYFGSPCGLFYGKENIVKFTPPSTGNYTVKVSGGSTSCSFGLAQKTSDGFCNTTSSVFQSPGSFVSGVRTYNVGSLTAGVSYDFIVDASDSSLTTQYAGISISCPLPTSVTASNIQPNSVTLTWNCSCPSTTYLEYGPQYFGPGTDANAGTGGTVIANVSSPYVLTGLTADTQYEIYLRTSCGGNFTANTTVLSVFTAQDCSTAPVVSCSDYLSFFMGPSYGASSWSSGCPTGGFTSREKIWRFTPSVTGAYSLFFYRTYSTTGNSGTSYYFIKPESAGCNELNWTCIGSVSGSNFFTPPAILSTGTLTAGTTYLIRADAVYSEGISFGFFFRIDCPNVCSYPLLSTATVTSISSVNINTECATCFGNNITIEYGPSGFTPGTDSLPGAGGTVVNGISSFPATLSGLALGTYDAYARKNCGAPNGFSANSNMVSFMLCSTIPSSVSASPSANICLGDSVTLTQVGGSLVAGGVYNWYTGSCGGTLVGTGPSITVSPSVTTTYFVRAEAFCGNTPCRQKIINVATPTATITSVGPPIFCAPGSVTLSATTGAGFSYQWRLNSSPISGATSSSYNATASGNFDCIVTNSCGSSTSNVITVSASGPCGSALDFTSSANSRVTINDNPSYAIGTGDFTLELWIRASSSQPSSTPVLVSKRVSASTGFMFSLDYAGHTILSMGGNYYGASGPDLRNNICHHVAVTRSTGQVRTYVDGILTTWNSTGGVNISSTHAIWIGRDEPSSNSFNGLIHEFRFWNYARSQAQIQAAKNIYLTGSESGLIGYWKMNEGSGQVVQDYSSTNNSGVLGSSVSAESIDPVYSSSGCIITTCPPFTATITASGPTTFCTPGSVSLNANAGSGLSYQWRMNGGNISGATSSSYNVTSGGNYDCIVSDTCVGNISNAIAVTVNSAPTANINAGGPATFCSPGSVTLNANTGTGLSYQWRLNGGDISGATSSSYNATATGNYDCMVSNSCGSAASNVISVTVNPLPTASITAAGPTTFCSPGSVTLNVNTGPGLSYQWRLNTGNISGATASSYAAASTGNYDCVVSNSCGSATSNAITVTVNPLPTATITASGPTTFCSPGSVNLNANTGPGLSYQWQVDGSPIAGETSSSYVANNTGNYNCIVTNSCGNAASNSIAVTVNTNPPAIIVPTGSTTFCFPGSVTLNANVDPNQSYQWRLNSIAIPGETSSSYTATSAGDFDCIVSNSCGSTTSNMITVTVNTAPTASITAAGPTTFCSPGSVALNANTGAGLSYQWRLNTGNISGAIASSYAAAATGNYDCVVSNSCGSTTSNAIAVTVNTTPTATISAAGPTTFCAPGSVTLNANTGAGLSYQWRLNTGNISGATSSSYTATATGNYDCMVSNICGSVTSNVISVTVNPAPTAVITAGGPTTVCSPNMVTLNANTGAGLSYQWRLNAGNISGANASSYNATATGNYDCIVSNSCGSITSNVISVTVNPLPTASVTVPGPTTVCSPNSVTLNANTGAGLSYQWRLNGGNISGATSSSYNASATGNYDCVVSNTCGNVASNVISVTVNPLPTASITAAGSTSVCSPNTVTLNANTGSGLSYQWKLNTSNISGATASSYNAATTGNYSCVVSNSCGSATSNTIAVTVAVIPATPGSITGQTTGVCSSVKTYSISAVSGATSYTWTAPAGATISSGQGTTSVNVTYTSSFGSGSISVAATSACGSSGTSTLAVSGIPAQPGPITGPASVCHNQNNVDYTIAAVTGATSYTWTVPAGDQIKNGQGTTHIRVRFGNSAGNITVTAINTCGASPVRTLAIAMPCRDNEISGDDLDVMLYPNPATNQLSIINYQSSIEKVEILDALGQSIVSQKPEAGSQQLTINISSLREGIYFIEVTSGVNKKILKFIKQE